MDGRPSIPRRQRREGPGCSQSILLLFAFIDSSLGSALEVYENTRVVFDHTLDADYLDRQLSKSGCSRQPTDRSSGLRGESDRIGGLQIAISTEPAGNVVLVKRT